MSSTVLAHVIRIGVVAVSLWVATAIVPGISLDTGTTQAWLGTLIVVSIIFGLANDVLKPIIKVVGCPLYVLTLGLVALVVNALLFWLTGWLSEALGLPFTVDGFWAAFWGAIVVGIAGFVLHLIIPDRWDQR
jgi:putative membrane protein